MRTESQILSWTDECALLHSGVAVEPVSDFESHGSSWEVRRATLKVSRQVTIPVRNARKWLLCTGFWVAPFAETMLLSEWLRLLPRAFAIRKTGFASSTTATRQISRKTDLNQRFVTKETNQERKKTGRFKFDDMNWTE
jgi:hypothetical protein